MALLEICSGVHNALLTNAAVTSWSSHWLWSFNTTNAPICELNVVYECKNKTSDPYLTSSAKCLGQMAYGILMMEPTTARAKNEYMTHTLVEFNGGIETFFLFSLFPLCIWVNKWEESAQALKLMNRQCCLRFKIHGNQTSIEHFNSIQMSDSFWYLSIMLEIPFKFIFRANTSFEYGMCFLYLFGNCANSSVK